MKQKILASIAIGIIISGVFTPVFGFLSIRLQIPITEAQCVGGPCGTEYGPQQQDPTTGGGGYSPLLDTGTATEQTAEEKKAAEDAANAAKKDALDCGLNPVCKTVKTLTSVLMYPSFLFAALGGFAMDYVLWSTINSTSYSDGTDGNQSGIGTLAVTGWKLVRDITNLLFIFALFVVAFNLILNRESENEQGRVVSVNSFNMDPKRTLARIIMMALLVNFSFFIGKSIISISNVTALMFFNKLDVGSGASEVNNQLNSNENTNGGGDISTLYGANYFPGIKSVSLKILSKANPQALVLQTQNESGTKISAFGQTLWGSYKWSTYIAMINIIITVTIFNFFLCYLFFSIAILLLGRTIGLVMALIISPLAFVSFAIPSLEDKPYIGFSDWFSQFIGLAATAPIFLFFLYLVVSSLSLGFAAGSDTGFFATTAFIGIKLAFVTGLLVLAKRITKNLAGKVGAATTKVATGIAVNIAMVGAAAATGGGSAALMMTRRIAADRLKSGATAVGNRVLGNERTAALQQRLGGLRNFRTLPSSPRDAIMGLASVVAPGSRVPGQINSGIKEGQKIGLRVKTDYFARKEAMDAQKAKGGTPATLGDGRTTKPQQDRFSGFTQTQEDRIKRKLKENQEKIAAQAPKPSAPTTPPPPNPPTNPPAASSTTNQPPAQGGAVTRPKNAFTGDVNFDRPKEPSKLLDQYGRPISQNNQTAQLVDVNGKPISSSTNAAQKSESERLTSIYNQEQAKKGNSLNVENLTVKNFNVQSTPGSSQATLPSRTTNSGLSPQKQATTLLSNIQMVPRASGGAASYSGSEGFKDEVKPVKPIGLTDQYGKPLTSSQQ